jgi:histidinol phosphatase-like enzyme (inositol monophosphatase family)
MTDPLELRQLLDFAAHLAREAGEITRHYFKSSFVTERKADRSFVTNADREAETYIRNAITQSFPADGILGEEKGSAQAPPDAAGSLIRSMEPTRLFMECRFTQVLIGLEIDDEPILGAVNLPALNELVYAARGLGCFWNDEPARVSSASSLSEALLLCTDFGTCAQNGFGPAAEALQERAGARRTWGDAYGHILVATGRADIMLDPVMNVWDCAALLPIVEEAGGRFTDWQGAARFKEATRFPPTPYFLIR